MGRNCWYIVVYGIPRRDGSREETEDLIPVNQTNIITMPQALKVSEDAFWAEVITQRRNDFERKVILKMMTFN